jgi:hypothetical protein
MVLSQTTDLTGQIHERLTSLDNALVELIHDLPPVADSGASRVPKPTLCVPSI